MADWYVSSVTYATVPVWVASTAYTVGQLVKPTAAQNNQRHAYRCTVAGTSGASEPSWPLTNNSTIVNGGATFTNVGGQSAYGWSAATGSIQSMSSRVLVGDRVFVSSDHSETMANAPLVLAFNNGTSAYGLIQVISVNRAGSVPPVPADILPGAAVTIGSGNLLLEAYTQTFWQGLTFTQPNNSNFLFNSSANKLSYMKDCTFNLTNTNSGRCITAGNVAKVIFDNTTVQFGGTGQGIFCTSTFDFNWINTPSAIQGATIPTTLFNCAGNAPPLSVTCRGVDLSAITGTLCSGATGTACSGMRAMFDSCKIASGVTRLATPVATANAGDEVELVNCYDGTNVINERYQYSGSLVTDRSTYLSGGAQDNIGNYSLKLVSSTRVDKSVLPLDAFTFDVENFAVGVSKTATVELISSGSLNNDDISLLLEYMGASGNPVASFVNSLPAVLATGTALPTSGVTWNSPPATPQKQLLQATFTPQRAGRVRGLVRLGKLSTTVWVNPQITVT